MLQNLLPLLPPADSARSMAVACGAAAAGVALWAAGARFSRSLLTLIAVAVGTFVGMRLPVWCGWGIDPMATGIAGAIVLGVGAFALPKMSVGVALAVALLTWASAAIWMTAGDPAWHWPAHAAGQNLPQHLRAIWDAVPPQVGKFLPAVGGLAVIAGVVLGPLWPRAGAVVSWTLAGQALLVGAALVLIAHASPASISALSARNASQIAALTVLAAVGAALQWQLLPAPPAAPPKAKEPA